MKALKEAFVIGGMAAAIISIIEPKVPVLVYVAVRDKVRPQPRFDPPWKPTH